MGEAIMEKGIRVASGELRVIRAQKRGRMILFPGKEVFYFHS
jgi:hypothetical protein